MQIPFDDLPILVTLRVAILRETGSGRHFILQKLDSKLTTRTHCLSAFNVRTGDFTSHSANVDRSTLEYWFEQGKLTINSLDPNEDFMQDKNVFISSTKSVR